MAANWSATAGALCLVLVPCVGSAGGVLRVPVARTTDDPTSPRPQRASEELMIAGTVVFAMAYTPSLVAGFELATGSSGSSGVALGYTLALPVLPSFVYGISAIANPYGCGGVFYGSCGLVGVGMLLSSAVQGVGLGLIIAGALGAQRATTRGPDRASARAQRTQWSIAPGAGSAALGLSLSAVHF